MHEPHEEMPDAEGVDQRGLYTKYLVKKNSAPPGEAPIWNPIDYQVFVLRFDDPNSWAALEKYAETVRDKHPRLAEDVLAFVYQHQARARRRELQQDLADRAAEKLASQLDHESAMESHGWPIKP